MNSPDGKKFTLARSFRCAAGGIAMTAGGRNFRIQLCFAVLAVVLGLAFQVSMQEWLVLFVCIGLVLGGECANTAIEAVVDLVSPGYHELAKRAKDCAAGAVLVFSCASLAVGVAMFAPRLLALVA